MTFSLAILLYIYFFLVFIWLVFSLVAVYHMMKFGFLNIITIVTTLLFVGVAVLLLFVSYYYLAPIDWQEEISLFNSIGNEKFGL